MNRRLYQWNGPHTNANELGVTAGDVPFGDTHLDYCADPDTCWACRTIAAGLTNWGAA